MNPLLELLRGNGADDGGSLVQKMRQLAPERQTAPLQRCSYQDVLDEQAEADRVTAAKFKAVLRNKVTMAAVQRNWEKAQRLAASAAELERWR